MKPWAFLGYFVIFALSGIFTMGGYIDPTWRLGFIESALPGFYSHTSNLVLSACLVLFYALARLISGGRLWEIAAFTLLVVAANYVYEVFLTLWNTKDPMDAHYGAAGALITFALMAAIGRWGMRPR